MTEGVALVQARGAKIVELHPGQKVYCPPGEEHWHGADPATATTWLEHITDTEYNAR